jgi:hypothetical protein
MKNKTPMERSVVSTTNIFFQFFYNVVSRGINLNGDMVLELV